MYEIFEKLIAERGASVASMCRDIGINRSSITDWKKGRSVPKLDKLQKIADYFGVPLSYLLTGEAEPAPDPMLSRLIAYYKTLNDAQKAQAIAYVKGMRDAYDAFVQSVGE